MTKFRSLIKNNTNDDVTNSGWLDTYSAMKWFPLRVFKGNHLTIYGVDLGGISTSVTWITEEVDQCTGLFPAMLDTKTLAMET